MRNYALNRWNWSERANKWVYVCLKDGKRIYSYQLTPPNEFEVLTNQLMKLNQRLMAEKDYERQIQIYHELMLLAQRMQYMRK